MLRTARSRFARGSSAIGGLVFVAGLVLAACGGGSGTGVASVSGSGQSASGASGSSGSSGSGQLTEAEALKFTKCMRAHGVGNFPDPTVDSSGNVQIGFRDRGNNASGGTAGQAPFDRRSPAFRTALTKCRKLLPTITLTPQQQTQFRDAALKFAQCMRAHGVNVPDPTFSRAAGPGGTGGAGGGRRGGVFGRDLNRNDPKVKTALSACQSLFANLPRRGLGLGGGGR